MVLYDGPWDYYVHYVLYVSFQSTQSIHFNHDLLPSALGTDYPYPENHRTALRTRNSTHGDYGDMTARVATDLELSGAETAQLPRSILGIALPPASCQAG